MAEAVGANQELKKVILELKEMLEGITKDFYRHRAQYLSDMAKLSATAVSNMKKSVLKIPIISEESAREAAGKYEAMRDMEYIRLAMEKIMKATENKVSSSILFSNWAVEELNTLFGGAGDNLSSLALYVQKHTDELRAALESDSEKHIELTKIYSGQHEDRFYRGVCTPKSSTLYQSMLDAFRDIFRHIKSCAVKVHNC